MMTEITSGIGQSDIKAGVIKLASGKDEISDYEKMFFAAGAKAQRETGVPIITHTQEGTMGPEQAEFLVSAGADANRVVIGHMDGNTDVSYHLVTLPGPWCHHRLRPLRHPGHRRRPDGQNACHVPHRSPRHGLRRQDRTLPRHRKRLARGRPPVFPDAVAPLPEGWHITHLFDDVVPVLNDAGVTDGIIDGIFVDNPSRIFGG